MSTDPVIPDLSKEPEPSAAVTAKRRRVHLAQSAVFALGEMPVKAKESSAAAELMAFLDSNAAKEIEELDSLIASELLGVEVKVTGHTKIEAAS